MNLKIQNKQSLVLTYQHYLEVESLSVNQKFLELKKAKKNQELSCLFLPGAYPGNHPDMTDKLLTGMYHINS